MNDETMTCRACGEDLPLSDFRPRSKTDPRPRGRQCRSCVYLADSGRMLASENREFNRLVSWPPTAA